MVAFGVCFLPCFVSALFHAIAWLCEYAFVILLAFGFIIGIAMKGIMSMFFHD